MAGSPSHFCTEKTLCDLCSQSLAADKYFCEIISALAEILRNIFFFWEISGEEIALDRCRHDGDGST